MSSPTEKLSALDKAVHGDNQAGGCWKKHWLFKVLTASIAKGRIWVKEFPSEEDTAVFESEAGGKEEICQID